MKMTDEQKIALNNLNSALRNFISAGCLHVAETTEGDIGRVYLYLERLEQKMSNSHEDDKSNEISS